MMLTHGIDKLANFSERSGRFYDPFGIGSPASLALAVFAEVVCAALLIPGIYTRLAALPLAITMMVAAFLRHAADPFATKEKALLFLVMYLVIACTGPGRFSVDYVFRKAR